MRARVTRTVVAALVLAGAARAQAQDPFSTPTAANPLLGSAPTGTASAEPIALSLEEAIQRGLKSNLALILSQQNVETAKAAATDARAPLLPDVHGALTASRQTINLAAYGFSQPGLEDLVGPFNVVDARVTADQTILDINALRKYRAEGEKVKAAEAGLRNTRDLVVLVCGNLYFATVAERSRVEAEESQLKTAESLYDLAQDRKQNGLVPAIEVLREQVQMEAERQQLIAAKNRLEQQKLRLARVIGLPPGQQFTLTDDMTHRDLPLFPADEAVARALAQRADVQAAERLVAAAEAARSAASAMRYPSVLAAGDYGAIGNSASSALATFTVGARVKVPIFDGGRTEAKIASTQADLDRRKAQLADLKSRVDYEVRSALLDLGAAQQRVQVADTARTLARQQLEQSQDRFAAGVAGNVEVVQSQEALARATDSWIESLYGEAAAKGALAQSLGGAETTYMQMVRGQ